MTVASSEARRLAAKGESRTLSVSSTTISFWFCCQPWFTPNSSVTSSRVEATLQTLEYAVRIFESSQRTLGTFWVVGASGAGAGRAAALLLVGRVRAGTCWGGVSAMM